MKHFAGRVAVITGGASGLGRAMALRFAREGMRIVLADINAGDLERTEGDLRAAGASAIGVRCDVSKAQDVEAVREERFYVLTHPKILGAVQARMEDILRGANPRDPLALR